MDVYFFRVVMSSGKAHTEIACTLSWFSNWTPEQRAAFGNSLLNTFRELHTEDDISLASLTKELDNMCVGRGNKEGPSVFQCQLKIFCKWYSNWDMNCKKEFASRLKSQYPEFTNVLETECNDLFV